MQLVSGTKARPAFPTAPAGFEWGFGKKEFKGQTIPKPVSKPDEPIAKAPRVDPQTGRFNLQLWAGALPSKRKREDENLVVPVDKRLLELDRREKRKEQDKEPTDEQRPRKRYRRKAPPNAVKAQSVPKKQRHEGEAAALCS